MWGCSHQYFWLNAVFFLYWLNSPFLLLGFNSGSCFNMNLALEFFKCVIELEPKWWKWKFLTKQVNYWVLVCFVFFSKTVSKFFLKPSRWFIAWYSPFNLQNAYLLLLQFTACTAQMSFHTLHRQGNWCISASKFPWIQVLWSLWFVLSEVGFSLVSCISAEVHTAAALLWTVLVVVRWNCQM